MTHPHNGDDSSTEALRAGRGDSSLGPDDLAALARLRVCALLLNASPTLLYAGQPAFQIALHLHGAYHLLERLTHREAELLVAEAEPSRRATLPKIFPYDTSLHDLRQVAAFVVEAELPRHHTERLRRVVGDLSRGFGLPVGCAAALDAVGWIVAPRIIDDEPTLCLVPRLPAAPSAHEAIEALLLCAEIGGLGNGPIGRLARAAANRLSHRRTP